MGRAERWTVILVATALLLAPAVAHSVGVRGHPQENRAPVALPDLASGWHVVARLSAYLNDRMPLRTTAIRGDGWVDEHVFREPRAFGGTALANTLHGRDGFLFLRNDIALECAPPIGTAATAAGLRDAMQAIAATGRDVVTMVAPNKTTIDGDLLPSDTNGLGCYRSYSDQLWEQLDTASIYGWVNVRRLMTATPPAGEERFKRTDTHWNGLGSILAVRAAVEHFRPGLWNEAEIVTGSQRYTGDLTVLDGRPFTDTTRSAEVRRPEVTRTSDAGVAAVPTPDSRHIVNTAAAGQLIPGKTLLLMDSFGIAAMDQIAPWFEDLTAVSLNDFDPSTFVSLIHDADRVWFLSVERQLPARVFSNWSSPSFIAALAAMGG
jgi:alginate O-acetyltransferase complex protein AlgJ